MQKKELFSLSESDLQYVARAAGDDLAQLSGAHIFLTGCTAFFGKWLIEALLYANEHLELNLRLTVLSRDPARFFHDMPHVRTQSALTVLKGDIMTAEMAQAPFTHAIHGANLPFDGTTDWPVRHMEAAVSGCRKIVERAAALRSASVLLLSSGAAYRAEGGAGPGAGAFQPFVENQARAQDNLAESNVYASTKRFMEIYAAALGESLGVRVPLARCFTFAGPHMPLDGPQALGNFIRDALAGSDIVIKGDGRPVRTYMYGADLVVWLLALLVRGRHGVPYNVGSEERITLRDAAKMIADSAGVSVVIQGRQIEGNAPSEYVPDTSRIKNELGVECAWPFARALAETMNWFRKNGNS